MKTSRNDQQEALVRAKNEYPVSEEFCQKSIFLSGSWEQLGCEDAVVQRAKAHGDRSTRISIDQERVTPRCPKAREKFKI